MIVKAKALNSVNAASVLRLRYRGWHLSENKVKEERETRIWWWCASISKDDSPIFQYHKNLHVFKSENAFISFWVPKPRCFSGIYFSKGQRPVCSANKDSFGVSSVGGLSLRHPQSGIALEKSCPLRIKLDDSDSRSKCLDIGKLNYVKLSLFYKLSPNPFHWVNFWSQTAVVSKWQNLWALPQDASGLKGLIVFPTCCWFYASERSPRSIWELWSWTRGWSQGSLMYPQMQHG